MMEQDKTEQDKRIEEARNAVETALVKLETLLDVAQSIEGNGSTRDIYLVAHTQVRSAKRVMWFEH
jgi:hypothetical protein